MNFKISYPLFIILGVLIFSPVKASTDKLPTCSEVACSDIFHNKKIGKATIVVWEGEGNIITSRTFDLDRSAVLVSKSNGGTLTNLLNTTSNAPPAPCSSGACSDSSSSSYETATEIITVTITFSYYNGQLIDVMISESRKANPPEMER